MKVKTNLDKDGFDINEEYFEKESESYEYEEYFPRETEKPPHY